MYRLIHHVNKRQLSPTSVPIRNGSYKKNIYVFQSIASPLRFDPPQFVKKVHKHVKHFTV